MRRREFTALRGKRGGMAARGTRAAARAHAAHWCAHEFSDIL